MTSPPPEAVIPRPTVLPPVSPTELLTCVINHCRYPSTVVIASSRQDFTEALSYNALPPPETTNPEEPQQAVQTPLSTSALLPRTLLQIAVSRHIRIVFMPSVTHLRAWLSVFAPTDSSAPAPPAPQSSDAPSLLVYGLIAAHRDTSEWSAQGVGASVAGLVDAAARHGFQAVLAEPKESETTQLSSQDSGREEFGREVLPLLKGMAMREDGTWSGRTVELRRLLGRWFEFEEPDRS